MGKRKMNSDKISKGGRKRHLGGREPLESTRKKKAMTERKVTYCRVNYKEPSTRTNSRHNGTKRRQIKWGRAKRHAR